ncbi:hypothetical protein R70211_01292 [Paraburkholderia domus]|uniref:Uncharacterized protein n=1 Tax=Paraburkholderia domus TaxID=2793075 RepID=A0A9N8QXG5_9BURK|nr:hypothetical protein R70211_01292 [Paraburkholderia domus]
MRQGCSCDAVTDDHGRPFAETAWVDEAGTVVRVDFR